MVVWTFQDSWSGLVCVNGHIYSLNPHGKSFFWLLLRTTTVSMKRMLVFSYSIYNATVMGERGLWKLTVNGKKSNLGFSHFIVFVTVLVFSKLFRIKLWLTKLMPHHVKPNPLYIGKIGKLRLLFSNVFFWFVVSDSYRKYGFPQLRWEFCRG